MKCCMSADLLFEEIFYNVMACLLAKGKHGVQFGIFFNKIYFWSVFVVLCNVLGEILVIYNERIPSRKYNYYKKHTLDSNLFIYFWVQPLR